MSITYRFLSCLLIAFHGLLAVGYIFRAGPLQYDPSTILLRGEPATLQHGVEADFPQIIGNFYAAITAGLIFALVNHVVGKREGGDGATSSVTAALIPWTFHWSIASVLFFDRNLSSGFVNTKDATNHMFSVLHGILCLLSLAALVSARGLRPELLAPKTPLNRIARFIQLLLGVGHGLIAMGLFLNVGPVFWEPAMFLVRGEPATSQPGLESAFPKYLGAIYCAISTSFLFSVTFGFASLASQTATIPAMIYHFAALHLHMFGESHIVNHEKMDPKQILIDHGCLGILSMVVFFLIGVQLSNNSTKTPRSMRKMKKQ
ncbi:hypothetical protein IV203_017885 [Nitzschia inconspicua]|uniref:Uncharacterized protein n=1 Tax=Nitzschia inconspicua TaxID=303405 RepID=A0A9K3Q5E1_9STRA|nr:hypothetical protein IV203_017885 [Nitzschia inconspicua]